mmetsp:Transcript_140/g.388  ORF Transcript_140/g.388 Transcript_140/m.388 type:complete len:226 (-) Transcript_140:161-838(-)
MCFCSAMIRSTAARRISGRSGLWQPAFTAHESTMESDSMPRLCIILYVWSAFPPRRFSTYPRIMIENVKRSGGVLPFPRSGSKNSLSTSSAASMSPAAVCTIRKLCRIRLVISMPTPLAASISASALFRTFLTSFSCLSHRAVLAAFAYAYSSIATSRWRSSPAWSPPRFSMRSSASYAPTFASAYASTPSRRSSSSTRSRRASSTTATTSSSRPRRAYALASPA